MKFEAVVDYLKSAAEELLKAATDLREEDPAKSFTAFQYSEQARKAAEVLARQDPLPAELGDGGSSWWYVCGECHGAVDRKDRFCRHCGRPVEQEGRNG